MEKIRVVILAAGEGTRMKSVIPKALQPLRGKPMIKHLLEAVSEAGVDQRPIVVVGHKADLVKKELGDKYEYVVQAEQLGTGHAVSVAERAAQGAARIIVLYSDHPLVSPATIKNLVETSERTGAKIVMATATVSDFSDWREFLYKNFSRIVRIENGKIVKDVQFRDATDAEKKITEINPCYFCFDAKWLWPQLKKLKTNNDQSQYYLTDLIKFAIAAAEKIETIEINPREALGANSKEELEILETLMLE